MPIDPSIHSRRNPSAATIQYHVNRINNAFVEYENAARTLNHTLSSDIHNYSSRERNLIINEQSDIAASRLGDYLYEYTWRGNNEMQENAREFGMLSFRTHSQQDRLPLVPVNIIINQVMNEYRNILPDLYNFTTPRHPVINNRNGPGHPANGPGHPANGPGHPSSPRKTSSDNEDRSHTKHIPGILKNCKLTFQHIADNPGPFQKLGKLMLRICSKTILPEISERTKPNASCPIIPDVKRLVLSHLRIPRAPQDYNAKMKIKELDPTNILPFIYNYWIDLEPSKKATFFKVKGEPFYMIQNIFFGAGIDQGGVSREIMSKLAEQIKDFCGLGYPDTSNRDSQKNNKIFVESVEGSGRYIINSRFKLNTFKMNIPGYSAQQISTNEHLITLQRKYDEINENLINKYPNIHARTYELYKFIGSYYTYCLINDISINIQLSHNLLYVLVGSSPINNINKIITYYLMDNAGHPGLARTIVKKDDSYMQTPEVYLAENDYNEPGIAGTINDYAEQHRPYDPPFTLHNGSRDLSITIHNLKHYIRKVAMYESYGRTISSTASLVGDLSTLRLDFKVANFISGFNSYDIIEVFKRTLKNKPVLTLDLLLSSYEIPTKPELHEHIHYPYRYIPTSSKMFTMKYFVNYIMFLQQSESIREGKKIYNWFQEILFDYGKDYPIDTEQYPNATDELREELFVEFFKKLIAFWSGNPKIIHGREYIINCIHSTIAGALPQSHTCFFAIDLPLNISSKEDLYRRLVIAVLNSDPGIGNAGGRRHNRIRHSKK